ncbi:MAG TPA: DUF3833 domain-containing protein [Casimicrobiaceae bacterium]|nr:DUF3833 domain-containing protein [Casimicrobiaceae bacterium]
MKTALIACMAAILAGCATTDEPRDQGTSPALDIATYFDGAVDGWGMVQDRSGKVLRRFTVRIDGRWDGDRGTLDEHFLFDDGERQRRVWTLVRDGDRFRATAGDVVGTGIGVPQGNAFNMRYVLAVPVGGRVWNLDMDDWMWTVDDRTVLNRTTMSKFGFRVGEVTLALRRR